jgi:hypothetical protein
VDAGFLGAIISDAVQERSIVVNVIPNAVIAKLSESIRQDLGIDAALLLDEGASMDFDDIVDMGADFVANTTISEA